MESEWKGVRCHNLRNESHGFCIQDINHGFVHSHVHSVNEYNSIVFLSLGIRLWSRDEPRFPHGDIGARYPDNGRGSRVLHIFLNDSKRGKLKARYFLPT